MHSLRRSAPFMESYWSSWASPSPWRKSFLRTSRPRSTKPSTSTFTSAVWYSCSSCMLPCAATASLRKVSFPNCFLTPSALRAIIRVPPSQRQACPLLPPLNYFTILGYGLVHTTQPTYTNSILSHAPPYVHKKTRTNSMEIPLTNSASYRFFVSSYYANSYVRKISNEYNYNNGSISFRFCQAYKITVGYELI
jgi:hypothetical protein